MLARGFHVQRGYIYCVQNLNTIRVKKVCDFLWTLFLLSTVNFGQVLCKLKLSVSVSASKVMAQIVFQSIRKLRKIDLNMIY
jgi:hypothetical protein